MNVFPQKIVPDYIPKPVYHETGIPDKPDPLFVEIKNDEQIQHMRNSCKMAANVLRDIEKHVCVSQCMQFNSILSILVKMGLFKIRHLIAILLNVCIMTDMFIFQYCV